MHSVHLVLFQNAHSRRLSFDFDDSSNKIAPLCKTINNHIDAHNNINQLDAYAGNFLGLSISRSSKGLYQKVLSVHSTNMPQLKSVVSEVQIADHTRRASVSTQNPLVSG
jgi:hypothetical protein